MLNPFELTGRAATHVEEAPALRCVVHRRAASALAALTEAARAEGIDLAVVSAFRGFDRQVAIWNAKFRGERPLLDRCGRELDRSCLDEATLVDSILNWSALPGASRHHWGSDIDVIDRAAIPPGYTPRLVPEEFADGGVFARLGAWLEANLGRFDFFRPYTRDRGGVMPEPWHLSYAPVAVPALTALTLDVLLDALAASDLLGREQVLGRLPELYERFVLGVDSPNPA